MTEEKKEKREEDEQVLPPTYTAPSDPDDDRGFITIETGNPEFAEPDIERPNEPLRNRDEDASGSST